MWLYAKKLTAENSNGCSVLDDKATLGGYSSGGYSCLAASAALHRLGVFILQASVGAAPIKLASAQISASMGA